MTGMARRVTTRTTMRTARRVMTRMARANEDRKKADNKDGKAGK
jgi:hypothetical protein